MKSPNKFFKPALFVCALAFAVAGPAFAKKQSVLKELPQRMMWQIDAPTGTTIYVFGTAHIVNEELAKVEPEVINMFLNADERYAELPLDFLPKAQGEMLKLMFSTLSFDEKGNLKNISDYLTDEGLELLSKILREHDEKAAAMSDDVFATSFFHLPPWALDSVVSVYGLSALGYSSQGHDNIFYQVAMKAGQSVLGLDTWEAQAKALSFGTYEEQAALLQLTLDMIMNGMMKEIVAGMFEAYKNNDYEAMLNIMEMELETQAENISEEFIKEKNELMFGKRNASWASQIEKMLKKKNKTFFIFTGAGHWVGENSVFGLLMKKGLLVEEN